MLTLEEKINNLPRTIRKELNQKILQWREAVKENAGYSRFYPEMY